MLHSLCHRKKTELTTKILICSSKLSVEPWKWCVLWFKLYQLQFTININTLYFQNTFIFFVQRIFPKVSTEQQGKKKKIKQKKTHTHSKALQGLSEVNGHKNHRDCLCRCRVQPLCRKASENVQHVKPSGERAAAAGDHVRFHSCQKPELQQAHARQCWTGEDRQNAVWSDGYRFLQRPGDGWVRVQRQQHEYIDPVYRVWHCRLLVWGMFSWLTLGPLIPINHCLRARV